MSMLLGVSVSLPTVSAILSGCATPPEPYAPRAVSSDTLRLLGEVAEIILPETDTPGARQAGVHRFIDTMLVDYYSADEARAFQEAFSTFVIRTTGEDGALDEALVAGEDRLAYQAPSSAREFGQPFDDAQFFRRLKELVIAGYYTSEDGASRELTPNPMGPYRGDVPMEEIGRAWS